MSRKSSKVKTYISVVALILTLLANILIILAAILMWRYSGLERGTFLALIGAVACILIILDVVFIFAFVFKDNKLKIATLVFALVMTLAGAYGNYLLFRVNNAVDSMIQSGDEHYETISASLVVYDSEVSSSSELDGLVVGMVEGTEASPSALGQSKLNEAGVSPRYEEYGSIDELMSALIAKEVDAAILPSGFHSMYADQEGYAEYLDSMTTLEEWSEDMQTGSNDSQNIDLSMEPFNVLLIGYAPESDTYGLADSIIVASVNPKTLTVTMTSIPRDSYVTIAGTSSKQKINAARGISRQCLMDTVSDMLGIEIDMYMEVNFKGVVEIVDALGGIEIDSPVAFLAQDSSTERGHYTVRIEEGVQWADGEMALAFARERHAMPNGDYDRELHQQQVITQIVSRLLELNDINRALDALEAAGNNLETNISLDQLTSLFNYLLSIPNYTGLKTMDLIDSQNMRVTGYSSYYHDYGSGLNLWIMIPYEGSIAENLARIEDTMGSATNTQEALFSFSAKEPYERGVLYHEVFDEVQVHPEIPEAIPDFIAESATLADVQAWASENDVTLDVHYIDESDDRYVEGTSGLVVDFSPSAGTLVSEMSGPLTVYVTATDGEIPNFVGQPLSSLESWASANGYEVSVDYIEEGDYGYDASRAGLISSQNPGAGEDSRYYSVISVEVFAQSSGSSAEATGDPYDVPGMSYDEAVMWCENNNRSCVFIDSNWDYVYSGTVSDNWGYSESGDGSIWFMME